MQGLSILHTLEELADQTGDSGNPDPSGKLEGVAALRSPVVPHNINKRAPALRYCCAARTVRRPLRLDP